jgi:hypothetical protein
MIQTSHKNIQNIQELEKGRTQHTHFPITHV